MNKALKAVFSDDPVLHLSSHMQPQVTKGASCLPALASQHRTLLALQQGESDYGVRSFGEGLPFKGQIHFQTTASPPFLIRDITRTMRWLTLQGK